MRPTSQFQVAADRDIDRRCEGENGFGDNLHRQGTRKKRRRANAVREMDKLYVHGNKQTCFVNVFVSE